MSLVSSWTNSLSRY